MKVGLLTFTKLTFERYLGLSARVFDGSDAIFCYDENYGDDASHVLNDSATTITDRDRLTHN